MTFEFATATRIMFGDGVAEQAIAGAIAMGRRVLLVTGSSPEHASRFAEGLARAGAAVTSLACPGEPTVELVRDGVALAKQQACDAVVAVGGGSAIDAGKAVAALLANPGDPLDYLEVIGRGRPLENPSAPLIAIPTTAGTGSEVTRNAVLGSHEHGVKASLRGPGMLPRLAAVDPELTLGLPRPTTASTGLDALTQLIEPYVSVRANPMTDQFCVEGMRRAASALPRVWANGADREARRDMSWASLLGGLSLANAGLGAAHGLAAPLGGMYRAPHGAICAAVLPAVMETNIRALRERAPDSEALRRYDEVARLVTGRPRAVAEDGVARVAELCRLLEIPPLRTHGLTEAQLPEVAAKGAAASSMKANPIPLTVEEIQGILAASL